MNDQDPELPRTLMEWWPAVWPLLGGLGGSIVSLGLARNVELAARRKAFNVLAGTIIAVFLGPLVVRWTLGTTRGDTEIVGAIYCLVGLSATSLTDRIVKRIGDFVDRFPGPPAKESE